MRTESMPAGIAFKTEKPGHRGGFTLVELLVVIMIIALLAAIVTPAVMRAMASSRAAAVKSEIEMLHMALMNYKNEYGAFPPADMRNLWNGRSVDTSHPAYKHLQRIFPRNQEPTGGPASPYYWMAQMSPAQALVFWLQGYFDNPQYPLTNGTQLSPAMPRAGTAGAKRIKFFDFDESRLYSATAYWPPTTPAEVPLASQTFTVRNAAPTPFAREYPVYFPNQANGGLPYLYFTNSDYAKAPIRNVTSAIPSPNFSSKDLYYTATSLTGDSSAAAPYFNSTNCSALTNPPQYSWAQLHMNPDTFQLVAAGADGTYGTKVAGFPSDAAFSFGNTTNGPFPSVKNNVGHEDNITNFANGPLKSAAEKMSQ